MRIPACAAVVFLAACASEQSAGPAPPAPAGESAVVALLKRSPKPKGAAWFLYANAAGWRAMMAQNWGHALPMAMHFAPSAGFTHVLFEYSLTDFDDTLFYVKQGRWGAKTLADVLLKGGFKSTGDEGGFTLLHNDEFKTTLAAADGEALAGSDDSIRGSIRHEGSFLADSKTLMQALGEAGEGDVIVGAADDRAVEAVVASCRIDGDETTFTVVGLCRDEAAAKGLTDQWLERFDEETMIYRSSQDGRFSVTAKGRSKNLGRVTSPVGDPYRDR